MPHVHCNLSLSGNTYLEKLNYFCALNNLKLYDRVIKQWSNASVVSIRIMTPRFNKTTQREVFDPTGKIKVFPTPNAEEAKEMLAQEWLEELGLQDFSQNEQSLLVNGQ